MLANKGDVTRVANKDNVASDTKYYVEESNPVAATKGEQIASTTLSRWKQGSNERRAMLQKEVLQLQRAARDDAEVVKTASGCDDVSMGQHVLGWWVVLKVGDES
jgi:hypothetical protein